MSDNEHSYSYPQVKVDEADIHALVHGFYAKVRENQDLGPIFDNVIQDTWPEHLETMCEFWSSLINYTGRYKGKPLGMHLRLKSVRPEHFDIWLLLFKETAYEVFDEATAPAFTERAERIAGIFQANMFFEAAE